eukprot:SM000016S01961  [mRNA]  locus=s16:907318:907948:- [translate_table: standard]
MTERQSATGLTWTRLVRFEMLGGRLPTKRLPAMLSTTVKRSCPMEGETANEAVVEQHELRQRQSKLPDAGRNGATEHVAGQDREQDRKQSQAVWDPLRHDVVIDGEHFLACAKE